ncbi:MAG: transglutaminase domain-containing protein [Bacteroidota bacterium]
MKKIIIATILLINTIAFSQKNELGKVTLDELKEKVCPQDSSSVAAFIFKKSKIKYDNSLGYVVTETEVKMKIYKKEGYDYANVQEIYYIGNGEGVDFSEVFTYNLVNGQIVKTKLKKESEFKQELTKNISAKKIAIPDVREGSIIEYKIKRYSHNTFRLVNYYLQEKIPINDIELKVEFPNRFYYSKTLTGYLSPEIADDIFNDINSKYPQIRTIYKLKNVPAFKDEGYVNNIDNYRSRIRYELASVKNSLGISENISTDWETVVKRIYESEYFGDELKKTGYFEKDIDVLLNGLTTQEAKINAIFNYVRSKMTWNENLGFACDEGVKKAYQANKGNVADINLMLTAMLRYAGFDANPILLSTRSNGLPLFPTIVAFNYVISGIESSERIILLDATDKNAQPDILPVRDLNWIGRIIKKSGSSAEIDLMPKSNSKDIVNIMASITDEGEVTGKIRDQYYDYNAFVFRQDNVVISKETYIEKLEKEHPGLEIDEYEVQNTTDLSKPIIENYSFRSTNSVEIIGDKMYVSPFLFFAKTENPFKQETREYPVDFVYPNQDKYNISLTIPDGYTVEVLPLGKNVSMPDNLANFKYLILNNGNQIQLMFNFDTNQAIIGSEYYDELKAFYKEIVDKQTEKIVLKKV